MDGFIKTVKEYRQLRKEAVAGMLGMAALGHVGSNAWLKKHMKSKKFVEALQKAFTNAPRGKGIIAGAKEIGEGAVSGALMPEKRIFKNQFYDLGQKANRYMQRYGITPETITPQQKDFIENMVNYRFQGMGKVFNKKDPAHRLAANMLQRNLKNLGISANIQKLLEEPVAGAALKDLSAILSKKDYPFTSDILPKVLSPKSLLSIQPGPQAGKKLYDIGYSAGVGSNFVPIPGVFNPAQGAVQVGKTYLGSKYSPSILQKTFLADPLKKAFDKGKITGVYDPSTKTRKAFDLFINPTTGSFINQSGELGAWANKYQDILK